MVITITNDCYIMMYTFLKKQNQRENPKLFYNLNRTYGKNRFEVDQLKSATGSSKAVTDLCFLKSEAHYIWGTLLREMIY